MEIAGLDKNLETLTYFQYLNLQWKRRYYEPGSFSMRILAADYDPRVKFLYTPDRPEVGMVEKVDYERTAQGEFVQLSGSFLEALYNRIYAYPHIKGKHTLAALLAYANHPWYALDLYTVQPDAGAFAATEVDVSWQNDTITDCLYSTLKTIELSWRFALDPNTGVLAMRVWQGLDRTQAQEENAFALFSDDSHHVTEFSYTEDESGYKNHAVVFYGSDSIGDPYRHDVYTENWQTEGRRWLMMNVDDDLTEAERTQKAHDELKKYPIVQSADIEVIQSGLLYRKDYDLGDKCDVVCHRLGKSFATRITGVNEVFKAGQHSVSLTFGESASTVYQRVARHGRGDVRGYELPQITSRRVRILMPGNDWQTATINSPKTGV